jgi:hypothetical protein
MIDESLTSVEGGPRLREAGWTRGTARIDAVALRSCWKNPARRADHALGDGHASGGDASGDGIDDGRPDGDSVTAKGGRRRSWRGRWR